MGEWWEPSSITLTSASLAPAAPEPVLRERGVPEHEHRSIEPRSAVLEIQSLMLTRDPERHPDREGAPHSDTDGVRRVGGVRRKQYAGNARFRRGTVKGTDGRILASEQRLSARATDWNGPWRRSTDRSSGDQIT